MTHRRDRQSPPRGQSHYGAQSTVQRELSDSSLIEVVSIDIEDNPDPGDVFSADITLRNTALIINPLTEPDSCEPFGETVEGFNIRVEAGAGGERVANLDRCIPRRPSDGNEMTWGFSLTAPNEDTTIDVGFDVYGNQTDNFLLSETREVTVGDPGGGGGGDLQVPSPSDMDVTCTGLSPQTAPAGENFDVSADFEVEAPREPPLFAEWVVEVTLEVDGSFLAQEDVTITPGTTTESASITATGLEFATQGDREISVEATDVSEFAA